jgi:hypothetical protein
MSQRAVQSNANEKALQPHWTLDGISARGCVGWREWVTLPDLKLPFIEAKIDTGARSSSLDATVVEAFRRKRQSWVRFVVFSDIDLSSAGSIVEAKLIGYRDVRSSNGITQSRPVIETSIRLALDTWMIELTLTSRRSMGFRLLLGRSAIENRYLVDASKSYLAGIAPNDRS